MQRHKTKLVGSKRLSSLDGVKDVMIPGGHATPEKRAQRIFSKNARDTEGPEMADHTERRARFGF